MLSQQRSIFPFWSAKYWHWILWVIVIVFFSNCTAKKFLQNDEKFYTGASIKVDPRRSDSINEKLVKNLASQKLTPKPNDQLLGMRPSVWMYMRTDSTKKGFGKFLKEKFGRKPVLYNNDIPKKASSFMDQHLFNNGYFNAQTSYEVKHKKHEASIIYTIKPGNRFMMDSILFEDRLDSLSKHMCSCQDETILNKDDPYRLSELKKERIRISNDINNRGYYFFNENFVGYKVDSTSKDQDLTVLVSIKKSTPKKARTPYYVKNIQVFTNYSLGIDSAQNWKKSYVLGDIEFIGDSAQFDFEFLKTLIHFKTDTRYNYTDHQLTLEQLFSLKVFRFVDIRFTETDSSADELDVQVYLTPNLPQSVRLEVGASSKSNNFAGPGANVSYAHKNLFGGAEHFKFSIGGAYETQIGGTAQSGSSASEVTTSAELSVPRIWGPIRFDIDHFRDLPRTELELSFKRLSRSQFYTLRNFNLDYRYKWITSDLLSHRLSLVNIDFIKATNISESFQAFLDSNINLRGSFSEQLIFSSRYSLIYYNKKPSEGRSYWFINPSIEIAGNLLNTVGRLVSSESDSTRSIFGVAYSQYIKFDADWRYYVRLGNERWLAGRFFAGMGVPYGNSNTLPFIKQYFIGGSTSLRAFQARTLGPGTYIAAESTGLLIDQSGDIKLEANIEYRSNIYRLLEGAVFVDAGNIWLLNEDNRVGGEFNFNTFSSQIAVGTGFGLRFDFTYFILRTDLAFPLRIPSRAKGSRWVIDQIDFSREWRQENLILNVAIGYPF